MLDFLAYLFFLVHGLSGVEFALALERDGMTTTDTEFCIGEQLTFRCTFAASSYEWTVTGFLDGSMGNGGITSGQNMTVEEFVILTGGVNAFRMSSLQVTVFQGLVGERTITCREPGTSTGWQSDTITVLDYPPAPTISEVTSTTNPPSFTLTIQPPSARTKCVGGQYQLTISSSDSSEQNVTRIIPVANPPVTISDVVNSSVVPNFNICNNSYSFELALTVNTGTTNQKNGQFNYGERGSFSSNVSSGNNVSIFANTSIEGCSDVAVLVIDRVRDNDMSDATSMTTFIGEAVVNFTGTTDQYTCTPRIELPSGRRLSLPSFDCSASLHLQTESTERLATTQITALQKSCNENIGALAGVTSVAALYFVISVIIIITLAVANKRLKLQLIQQEGQSQYEMVGNKGHMSSVNKTLDVGMVKCQAYGEVAIKNRAGEVNELSSNAGVYEQI